MFGDVLKKLRLTSNFTQIELAKALGSTQKQISKWELNAIEPNIQWIVKIAKYFNVSTDYLLGLKDEYGYNLNENETYNFEYRHGDTKLIHQERREKK